MLILKLAWSRGLGVLGELEVSHSIMSNRGLVNQANFFAIFLQLHGRRETPELGSRGRHGLVLVPLDTRGGRNQRSLKKFGSSIFKVS